MLLSRRADHLGLTMLMLRIVLITFLGPTMLTLLFSSCMYLGLAILIMRLAVRLLIVLISGTHDADHVRRVFGPGVLGRREAI